MQISFYTAILLCHTPGRTGLAACSSCCWFWSPSLLAVSRRRRQPNSTAVRALPELQNDAAANPRKTFRVVIQRVKGNRNADAAVSPVRGAKVRDMANDAFVANVPGAAIKAMGRNPAIKFITYDAPMRKMGMVDPSNVGTVYPGTVNAPELWSSLTGAGIGVAVLDTGISSAPDWQDAAGNSRIAFQINFSSNATSLTDGSGHGTHVAGIIAGNSWNRSTSGLTGKYIGIAPEAKLINVKVSDDQGMSYAWMWLTRSSG